MGRHPGLLPFGNSAFGTTQHNTTQHNTTQHNTTQHNTTQHNTTQLNTTQHNRNWGWRGAVQGQLLSVEGPVRSCHFPSVRREEARGAGRAALLVQWPGVCGKIVEPTYSYQKQYDSTVFTAMLQVPFPAPHTCHTTSENHPNPQSKESQLQRSMSPMQLGTVTNPTAIVMQKSITLLPHQIAQVTLGPPNASS